MGNTPASVLSSIAHVCGCNVRNIEAALEELNNMAGLTPRPMKRETLSERRLDIIRAWLKIPEAGSVIDGARDYVRQMSGK